MATNMYLGGSPGGTGTPGFGQFPPKVPGGMYQTTGSSSVGGTPGNYGTGRLSQNADGQYGFWSTDGQTFSPVGGNTGANTTPGGAPSAGSSMTFGGPSDNSSRPTGFQMPGANGMVQDPSTGLWGSYGANGSFNPGGSSNNYGQGGGSGQQSSMSNPSMYGGTSASQESLNPYSTQPSSASGSANAGTPPRSYGVDTSTIGPSGWPAFLGDMGGVPPPNAQQISGMGLNPSTYGSQGSPQPQSMTGGNSSQFSMPGGQYTGSSYSQGMYSPSTWGSYANSSAAAPSPYLQNQLTAMKNSVNQDITQNILPSERSNAGAVGGIGGAREGIAQGTAVGNAMTGYQNAATQAISAANEQSQNRALQAYQGDQNAGLGYLNSDRNYGLGMGGLQNQYGLGMANVGLGYGNLGLGYTNAGNNYNLGLGGLQNQQNQLNANYNLGMGQLGLGYTNAGLQNQSQLMNFYGQQRGQDLASLQTAAQLYGMGQQGPWQSLQNQNSLFAPYTGFGTGTDTQSQGGGAMGAAGGALAGSALWKYLAGLGGSGG